MCNDAHVPRSGQSQKRDGPLTRSLREKCFSCLAAPRLLVAGLWFRVYRTALLLLLLLLHVVGNQLLGTLHFVALLSRLGDALSVRNSTGHLLGARHLDRVDPLPSPSPPFSFAGSASPLQENFTATIQYHHTPSTLHCMRRRRRWWFRGDSG